MSRGKVLELLRPDESGKMQTILATEVFGAIRALMPFRLTSGSRDYIIIGSDSGRIVIVDYNKEKNAFIKVLQLPQGVCQMHLAADSSLRPPASRYCTEDHQHGRAGLVMHQKQAAC